MTSANKNFTCVVVKKKLDDIKWSEIAFEDGDTGRRCRPKVLNVEQMATRGGPVHSEIHPGDDDISILSMEDEFSISNSLRNSKPQSNDEFKHTRRASIGRFAQRLGKRSGKDSGDDATISTSMSSSFCSFGKEDKSDDASVGCPPSYVRATPGNRFKFMSKNRTNHTQKYLGFKEFEKQQHQSEVRRGIINSALYSCMDTDDDEEDLLSTILRSGEELLQNTPANRAA